jgi:hypothetical protein
MLLLFISPSYTFAQVETTSFKNYLRFEFNLHRYRKLRQIEKNYSAHLFYIKQVNNGCILLDVN